MCFFSVIVETYTMLTDLEALPAFCITGTELFLTGKLAGASTNPSPPLCQVENWLVLYFHIPPPCLHRNIMG